MAQSGLRVDIAGFEQLARGFRSSARTLGALSPVHQHAGDVLARGMKAKAPVRTGALRASIGVTVGESSALVSTNVPYAKYLKKKRKKSLMAAAKRSSRASVTDIYQDAVVSAISEIRGA